MLTRFFDSSANAVFAILTFALLLLMLSVLPAEAKGKKLVNGCTDDQIKGASQCINQMEADIIANAPTYHAVYCSSLGTVYCCQFKDGEIQPHSCDKVSRANRSIFSTTGSLGAAVDGGTDEPSGGGSSSSSDNGGYDSGTTDSDSGSGGGAAGTAESTVSTTLTTSTGAVGTIF